jgi:hypothetical protein
MHSVIADQFFWRVFAETGHVPYFGGSGIGLLPLLYELSGPWPAAVCTGNAASPVEAWLREHTDAELLCFSTVPGGQQNLPEARPQGTWDAGTVPLVLGEVERDVLHVGGIAFGFGASPGFYRERPLDHLLGQCRTRVGLIHLGSLNGAARVIGGARNLLRRCSPALLVNREAAMEARRGIPELAALASVLAEAGYTLHDSMLSPLRTAEDLGGALELWHETAFFALPEGEGIDQRAFIRAYRANPSGYQAHTQDQIRLRADEIIGCSGLYPAEHWEDLSWRWTGPLPRAYISLPVGRPGRYRFRLRLLKVADDGVLDTLRIFVNGIRVEHTVKANEHDIVVAGLLTLSPTNHSSPAELGIVHSETYFINPDDPRRLGMALIDIGLERQP